MGLLSKLGRGVAKSAAAAPAPQIRTLSAIEGLPPIRIIGDGTPDASFMDNLNRSLASLQARAPRLVGGKNGLL